MTHILLKRHNSQSISFIQIGSILHAQLEIWKAAYGDASYIDSNALTSSACPSSSNTAAPGMSQTSLWNQMLNDDSEISDGNLATSEAL